MSAQAAFEGVIARVRTAQPHTRVAGLTGLGVAHTVLELAKVRPVVFVPKSQAATDDLLRDLRFVAGPGRAQRVLFLPADDRTPYHATSPDPLVVMERTAALFKVATGQAFDVVVVPPEALCRRGLPFAELQRLGCVITQGGEVDRDALAKKLIVGGYSQVSTVEDAGTFAVRGSVVDIFWAGMDHPVRLDLFGDTVESLKTFNPETQRAEHPIEELTVGPAREVFLDDSTVKRAVARLRDLADHVEYPTKKLRELVEDLENRIPFFGIEGLLPAFYDGSSSRSTSCGARSGRGSSPSSWRTPSPGWPPWTRPGPTTTSTTAPR